MPNKFKTLSEAEAAYAALEGFNGDAGAAAKALVAERAAHNVALNRAQSETKNWQSRAVAAVKASASAPVDTVTPQLRAELNSANMALASARSDASTLRCQVAALTANLAAAKLENIQAVNRKANDILAAAGHCPLPLGKDQLGDEGKALNPALRGRDLMIEAARRSIAKASNPDA